MHMLTKGDKKQIEAQGMSVETVEKQLQRFGKGFPQLNIVAPATLENGILRQADEEKKNYRTLYQKRQKTSKIFKFVPASGAASRMFKKIYEIIDAFDGSEEKYLELLTDRSPNSIYYVCENIQDFAFFKRLEQICSEKGDCINSKISKKDYVGALELIVSDKGLNYGNFPKGLIQFHTYKNETRTSLEEHLAEGAMYAKSKKEVNIHFTVSPEFYDDFKAHINDVIEKYEEQFSVKYNIELSIQKKRTDTIAVDMDNNPAKNEDGQIVFRPGGHGALLENLKDIDADLIFIKNIDNVVTDRLKPTTVEYKELLGGLLFDLKEKAHHYIGKLKAKEDITTGYLTKIGNFCQEKLNIDLPEKFKDQPDEDRIRILFEHLNRPIRICGMVKNEDEPGGGPFWVMDEKGEKSIQIVESSQFDKTDKAQMKVFQSATHFNPVDIACSIKDYENNQFDLSKFKDEETGFISEKTLKGRPIKALEHPGLWNGAMANWITVFVEVPMDTFNPVKTINDLLRKEHRF